MLRYVVLDVMLSEYVILVDGRIISWSCKEDAENWIESVEEITDYEQEVTGRYLVEALDIPITDNRFNKYDIDIETVIGISTVYEFDEVIQVRIVKEV